MSSKNYGIVASTGKFAIKEIQYPVAKYNHAIIKVNAVSLNRGELRTVFSRKEEWVPGWDFTGEIIQAAENGSGPKLNERVVGFLPNGSWAQYVTVPADTLAVLPENVTDAHASTLPVAGLTALYALSKGKQLLGKRVLITGATGGVGMFAIQLAALSGAHVTALIRNKEDEQFIKDLGADEVLINDYDNAQPFDLVLDSIGGDEIGKLIKKVKPFGTVVSFGNSSEKPQASYEVTSMYRSSVTLYGFILFNEVKLQPASVGLSVLANLVSNNKLKVLVEKEVDWNNIEKIANELLDRKFKGKAVLHIKHDE